MRSRTGRTVTTVESESEGASSATDKKVFVFEYAGSKLDPVRANRRFRRIRHSARPESWDNSRSAHLEVHFNLGDLVTDHHRDVLLDRCEVCL
jgi:hypothetical protein